MLCTRRRIPASISSRISRRGRWRKLRRIKNRSWSTNASRLICSGDSMHVRQDSAESPPLWDRVSVMRKAADLGWGRPSLYRLQLTRICRVRARGYITGYPPELPPGAGSIAATRTWDAGRPFSSRTKPQILPMKYFYLRTPKAELVDQQAVKPKVCRKLPSTGLSSQTRLSIATSSFVDLLRSLRGGNVRAASHGLRSQPVSPRTKALSPSPGRGLLQ